MKNKADQKNILPILFTIILLIAGIVWLSCTFITLIKEYKVEKAERIAKANIVREFIEDKSIVEVDAKYRHVFNNEPGYDLTITIENPEGIKETQTFEKYDYTTLKSHDNNWHMSITDDGYITVYQPINIYTSK